MIPMPQIRRALLSVSDKTGLVALAGELAARGIELLSTGGTAHELADAGLPVTEVAAATGVAEFLDGRVKTLHPAIHGGLLARRDRPDHLAAIAARGIAPIDLLVCNLYPFAATVAAARRPRAMHRGDRHRRRRSDPRRGQESRRRDGGNRSGRLRPRARRYRQRRRRGRGLVAAPIGAQGLCPDGRLRCGDRRLAGARRRRRVSRNSGRCPDGWRKRCATARTRTRRAPSIAPARPAPASRPHANCRAANCPTTITPTPTPLLRRSPNSPRRPSSSSSTPTRAAWPSAPACTRRGRRLSPATPSAPLAGSSR